MFANLARALAGVAAVGLGAALAGCSSDAHVTIDGVSGVPLAQLDTSGKAPDTITLLGPDTVHVTGGDRLAITVDGDPAIKDQLRFTLKDGNLGITREKHGFGQGGTVTINVVVPPLQGIVLMGSGTVQSDALHGEDARVVIAGSGSVDSTRVDVGTLKVDVLGPGTVRAAGHARNLALTIGGSGNADLSGLSVDAAKADVAGSGSGRFASDGTVDASILGSGDIHVRGRATCTVKTMGSGTLVCEAA